MRCNRTAVFAGLILTCVPQATPAADKPTVATIKKVAAAHDGIFGFDYGAPSSPALSIAGLSADKTTVSSSLKPFVLTLPTLVDGADSQTAAIDLIPISLFPRGGRATIEDYQANGWLYRAVNRLHVGFAGTNGAYADGKAAKQKPSRLALSASLSLLDSSDPLLMRDRKTGNYAFDQCLLSIPDERLPIAMSTAFSRYKDEAIFLQSDVFNDKVTEEELKSLRRDFGTPTAIALAPIKAPDARTVEALTYLMNRAEAAGDSAGRDLYRGKLREALGADAPSVQGPSQKLAPGDKAYYLKKLDAEIAKRDKAFENASKLFATDLGYLDAAKTCGKSVSQIAMYRTQVNVGVAKLWRGAPGRLKKFHGGGEALWVGLRAPLIRNFSTDPAKAAKGPISALMVGGSIRYGQHEYLETKDDTTPLFRANHWDFWAGLDYLSDTLQVGAQVGWTKAIANDQTLDRFSNKGMRWLGSTKVRLSSAEQGIWLGASYGHANGNTDNLKDKTFLLTVIFGPPDGPNLFGEKAKDK